MGLDQKGFAAVAGVNKNSQLSYELGRTAPDTNYLEKIGEAGADIIYILTGSRAGPAGGDNGPARPRDDDVQVAEIDPRFGLGNVFMDEEAVPELRSFSRSWLRQITTSPPEELYWARGRGNSMSPTIEDGEIMLIDRSQQSVLDADLIWAFAWGDVGAIKRLRPMPDGSLKILSDNPAVPPETASEGEVHIFGRVTAVIKNI